MTSLAEFLDVFQGTKFARRRRALVRFYRSAKKTVVLSFFVGPVGLFVLLKLTRRDQWPILRRMDNPDLSIYKDTDPELRRAFIDTIRRQKKRNSWSSLRGIILERAELYKDIFEFSPEDLKACERIGRRFEGILIRRRRRQRWMVGGAVATAGLGTLGAFLLWKSMTGKK